MVAEGTDEGTLASVSTEVDLEVARMHHLLTAVDHWTEECSAFEVSRHNVMLRGLAFSDPRCHPRRSRCIEEMGRAAHFKITWATNLEFLR